MKKTDINNSANNTLIYTSLIPKTDATPSFNVLLKCMPVMLDDSHLTSIFRSVWNDSLKVGRPATRQKAGGEGGKNMYANPVTACIAVEEVAEER